MKELSRDQRGFISVIILVLMPLLIISMVGAAEISRIGSGSNMDIQGALDQAVKAAAMCVDSASQANGDPRIDPDRAHEQFRHFLAVNLRLDSSLNPVYGSSVTNSPKYTFIVCNGDNNFVPEGRVYSCDGTCTATDIFLTLPQTFTITDDIYFGSGGLRDITISKPSCIAFVRTRVKPIFVNENEETTRWSSARIVKRF